jgi:hypothetical protein
MIDAVEEVDDLLVAGLCGFLLGVDPVVAGHQLVAELAALLGRLARLTQRVQGVLNYTQVFQLMNQNVQKLQVKQLTPTDLQLLLLLLLSCWLHCFLLLCHSYSRFRKFQRF